MITMILSLMKYRYIIIALLYHGLCYMLGSSTWH